MNIGIVLESATTGFVGSRFLSDFSRVKQFDPDVNEIVLQDFAIVSRSKVSLLKIHGVENTQNRISSPPEFLTTLSRCYSGIIQYDKPRAVLTDDPVETLSRLYEELVAPPSRRSRTHRIGADEMLADSKTRGLHKYTAASLRRDVLKNLLDSPRLHPYIKPKYEVKGSVSPWFFDAGLRNGAIHVVQTLSFDVKTAEDKHDRALILKGKVEDARSANPGVQLNAYAIVLPPEDAASVKGYQESIQLLTGSGIETHEPGEVGEVVSELERKVAVH